MRINDDLAFKRVLEHQSIEQQRQLGALFAERALKLIDNQRLSRALQSVTHRRSDDESLHSSYKVAKSIATRTYTTCGGDADWRLQAEHFAASACVSALTPDNLLTRRSNPAWRAAVQSRRATRCLIIHHQTQASQSEAEHQYRLTEQFLQHLPD